MIILLNILIFVLLVFFQSTFFGRFDIFGFTPNLILILVVAFSLYRRTYEAYAFAFVTGLVLDTLSAGPFGIHTAIFMVSVFVSGILVDEDHTKLSVSFATIFLAVTAILFYISLWAIVSYQAKNFTAGGLTFSFFQAGFTTGFFFLAFPFLRRLFLWEEKTADVRVR